MDQELKDTIDILISGINRDKKLGELEEELQERLIAISTALDIGSIDYNELKDYISSKLDIEDILPGTVGYILLGCTDKAGSCVLGGNDTKDTSFLYDAESNHITRISGVGVPLSPNSYAVIHSLVDVDDIDLDVFKMLETKGFEKVKLLKKSVGSDENEEVVIENLKQYIYSRPERLVNIYYVLAVIVAIAVLGFAYRYHQRNSNN
jgi:hypothetical protein